MVFLSDGIIQKILSILGIQVTTATGQYIVYLSACVLLVVSLISLMVLLFKFLVYLRRG